MANATHFRLRAELCLQIARQLSMRREAEQLRADAAGYMEQADNLDKLREKAFSAPGRFPLTRPT